MANILAFSFFPAFLPPRNGGEVRVFGIYDALSRHHSVVLLTSGHLGAEVEHVQHNARFKEIRVPKDSAFTDAWARLAPHAGEGDLSAPCVAEASAIPGLMHQYYLDHIKDADVIIHDFPFTVGYDLLIGLDGKPRIYASHNVEADLYRELHKEGDAGEILKIVDEAERLLCQHANLVTVCSMEDGDRLRSLYHYRGRLDVIPNGIDSFPPLVRSKRGKDLIFIGSGHRPNRTAAEMIVHKFAPAMPDVHFRLLGTCYEAGQPLPNVTAHGMVDEQTKKAIFASACASLNPIDEGSGSSLKVADLAANGVPLISTQMGVRGFEFADGKHYHKLESPQDIAGVRDAIQNTKHLAKLAEQAAAHIADKFTWNRIGRRLASRIDQLLEEQEQPKAEPHFLVLNDYNAFGSVGGGATRTRGLYEGVCETARITMLCFSNGDRFERDEILGGKATVLSVPKTESHKSLDVLQAKAHHVSIADILAIEQAPKNPFLRSIYEALAPHASLVLCEHPYMAGLPRLQGDRFVYSSQNYETGLKENLLVGHPQREEMLRQVKDIEQFSVGCSELVIAVSQDDAISFGANFDLVAPIIVIPNGAEEPVQPSVNAAVPAGFNACFLGSAHMPNVEAAQYIVNVLAPRLPNVRFHIAGSVCGALQATLPNVTLLGTLTDTEKADLLAGMQIALNPMLNGSGSNVKVADYLKNGLAVLSTEFGARGYESIPSSDLSIRPLDEFHGALTAMLASPSTPAAGVERKSRYEGKLSMLAYGRDYAAVLAKQLETRKRALLVTYRYNAPQRGGGEVYLVRLIRYLAASGVDVDVVAPNIQDIYDRDRFSSDYPLEGHGGPIPVEIPHVRAARFETVPVPDRENRLRKIWGQQPLFEKEVFAQFPVPDGITGLTWGWAGYEQTGRWAMTIFGWAMAKEGTCQLTGYAHAKRLLRVEDETGIVLGETIVEGTFSFSVHSQAGLICARVYEIAPFTPDDVRPLGLYIQSVEVDGQNLIGSVPLKPWEQTENPVNLFTGLHVAASAFRPRDDCSLSKARGPYSPGLEDYLQNCISDYDLVITHNAVFRTATEAVRLANGAGIPSLMVPHAHFEDDYYHFPDTMEAIRQATISLVSPRAACDFLTQLGAQNIAYHCPGIDTDEAFTSSDLGMFNALYKHDDPFVLVLGRKSLAKGYNHVIEAVRTLRAGALPNLRLVMIGPDDDKLPVNETFVDYLGMVDRSVVRGAYMACVLLANMSQSESFGIVILEAGLAKKPVVVNAYCPAFADLVSDGETGYLVAPDQLASRIGEIVTNDKLAAKLGAAGHEVALAYDWDRQGALFVTHCLDLMNRSENER